MELPSPTSNQANLHFYFTYRTAVPKLCGWHRYELNLFHLSGGWQSHTSIPYTWTAYTRFWYHSWHELQHKLEKKKIKNISQEKLVME